MEKLNISVSSLCITVVNYEVNYVGTGQHAVYWSAYLMTGSSFNLWQTSQGIFSRLVKYGIS